LTSLAVLLIKMINYMCACDGLTSKPGVERVMLEHFQDCHYDLRAFPQDAEGFFRTALKYTLSPRCPHSIDHVRRHTERDGLWYLQQFSLAKC
jgi:hypothetical protein